MTPSVKPKTGDGSMSKAEEGWVEALVRRRLGPDWRGKGAPSNMALSPEEEEEEEEGSCHLAGGLVASLRLPRRESSESEVSGSSCNEEMKEDVGDKPWGVVGVEANEAKTRRRSSTQEVAPRLEEFDIDAANGFTEGGFFESALVKTVTEHGEAEVESGEPCHVVSFGDGRSLATILAEVEAAGAEVELSPEDTLDPTFEAVLGDHSIPDADGVVTDLWLMGLRGAATSLGTTDATDPAFDLWNMGASFPRFPSWRGRRAAALEAQKEALERAEKVADIVAAILGDDEQDDIESVACSDEDLVGPPEATLEAVACSDEDLVGPPEDDVEFVATDEDLVGPPEAPLEFRRNSLGDENFGKEHRAPLRRSPRRLRLGCCASAVPIETVLKREEQSEHDDSARLLPKPPVTAMSPPTPTELQDEASSADAHAVKHHRCPPPPKLPRLAPETHVFAKSFDGNKNTPPLARETPARTKTTPSGEVKNVSHARRREDDTSTQGSTLPHQPVPTLPKVAPVRALVEGDGDPAARERSAAAPFPGDNYAPTCSGLSPAAQNSSNYETRSDAAANAQSSASCATTSRSNTVSSSKTGRADNARAAATQRDTPSSTATSTARAGPAGRAAPSTLEGASKNPTGSARAAAKPGILSSTATMKMRNPATTSSKMVSTSVVDDPQGATKQDTLPSTLTSATLATPSFPNTSKSNNAADVARVATRKEDAAAIPSTAKSTARDAPSSLETATLKNATDNARAPANQDAPPSKARGALSNSKTPTVSKGAADNARAGAKQDTPPSTATGSTRATPCSSSTSTSMSDNAADSASKAAEENATSATRAAPTCSKTVSKSAADNSHAAATEIIKSSTVTSAARAAPASSKTASRSAADSAGAATVEDAPPSTSPSGARAAPASSKPVPSSSQADSVRKVATGQTSAARAAPTSLSKTVSKGDDTREMTLGEDVAITKAPDKTRLPKKLPSEEDPYETAAVEKGHAARLPADGGDVYETAAVEKSHAATLSPAIVSPSAQTPARSLTAARVVTIDGKDGATAWEDFESAECELMPFMDPEMRYVKIHLGPPVLVRDQGLVAVDRKPRRFRRVAIPPRSLPKEVRQTRPELPLRTSAKASPPPRFDEAIETHHPGHRDNAFPASTRRLSIIQSAASTLHEYLAVARANDVHARSDDVYQRALEENPIAIHDFCMPTSSSQESASVLCDHLPHSNLPAGVAVVTPSLASAPDSLPSRPRPDVAPCHPANPGEIRLLRASTHKAL